MSEIHNSRRWRKLRKGILHREPLCRLCKEQGLTVAADQVDHIKPVSTRPELMWIKDNLQPLYKDCHDNKTGVENSRFRKVNLDGDLI